MNRIVARLTLICLSFDTIVCVLMKVFSNCHSNFANKKLRKSAIHCTSLLSTMSFSENTSSIKSQTVTFVLLMLFDSLQILKCPLDYEIFYQTFRLVFHESTSFLRSYDSLRSEISICCNFLTCSFAER